MSYLREYFELLNAVLRLTAVAAVPENSEPPV